MSSVGKKSRQLHEGEIIRDGQRFRPTGSTGRGGYKSYNRGTRKRK